MYPVVSFIVLVTEAVALLVDAQPRLLTETKSVIEAAKTGKCVCVMESGVHTFAYHTYPLH